jgi:hypothetical protein
MTDQEVFDFGYLAIVKQGKGSIDENGRCYYRHPNGIYRCVAGQFIPDQEYTSDMEQLSVLPDYSHSEEELLVKKIFEKLGINLELMQEMQRAHDHLCVRARRGLGSFLDLWKEGMIIVAIKFNLSTDIIK